MSGGRNRIWSRELEQKICDTIASSGCTLKDAATRCGISESTLYHRMSAAMRPDADESEVQFLQAVKKATIDGKLLDLAVITKAAKDGDWRASAWRLERKFPNEFGPRIRIHVESEVKEMMERLKAEFANEPALLERALSSLAGETRGRLVEGSVVPVDTGEDAFTPRVDSAPISTVRGAETPLEDASPLGENGEG